MSLAFELSKVLKTTISVREYLNIIQKWEKLFTKEICLHFLSFLDVVLKKCSKEIDISSKLSSVKDIIIDYSESSPQESPVFNTELKEILQYLINNMTRRWRSTLLGKDLNEFNEVWNVSQFLDNIINKLETFYKSASQVTKEEVNILTTMFVERCEQLLYSVCNFYEKETTFLSSWLFSCKIAKLISSILKIIDNIFEYLSSITSFTFDIPLEIGWEPYDINELAIILNDLEIVNTKRKTRSIGHH